MSYSEGVEVVDCRGQLVRNATCQVLADNKFALVEEGEEISAYEDLHDNIDRILVLEYVIELDYVRMLAHLEDFNLTFKQLQIFNRQLFLLDDLYGALKA